MGIFYLFDIMYLLLCLEGKNYSSRYNIIKKYRKGRRRGL